MDDKWRTISCPHCGGHGVTWNPESWFGVEECNECGESGRLWIRPLGHLFQYPGGPGAGMWDEKAYAEGTPMMPYEWHAWSASDEEINKFIVNSYTGSFDEDLNKVVCTCGFEGTLREHQAHAEEAERQFILEHKG